MTNIDLIQKRIWIVRGHPVLIEGDLVRFYAVPKAQVLAIARGFPGEFCFLLENWELPGFSGDSSDEEPPLLAFTEYGALALAYALGTPHAIAMGVRCIRAFGEFGKQDSSSAVLHNLPD